MRRLLLAGFAVAVFVRVYALADKPFWGDEAWVALLVRPPLTELSAARFPAPLGFLLAVKAASLLPGPAEVTLRVVPLAAGLATVALLPVLAGALGASRTAQVATLWLAAGMPALVNYSRELKHYSVDLLFATGVALLAFRLLGSDSRGAPGSRGGAALSLVAAAAPWFSFGAAFPVAATFLWGWCSRARAVSAAARLRWASASVAWAASFAAVWLLLLRHQAGSPRLQFAWRKAIHGFDRLPGTAGAAKAAALFFTKSISFLFPGIWPVAAAFALLGLLLWPGRGRTFLLWWIAATALLTTAAALGGRYVLSTGRLLLFAAPLFILPAAAGLVEAGRRLRVPPALPLLLAVGLSGFWSFQAVAHRVHPRQNAGFHFDKLPRLEPVLSTLAARRGAGEPLFVVRRLGPPFLVYAGERFPGAVIQPSPRAGETARAIETGLAGRFASFPERGWVLLTPKDRRRIRRALAAAGRETAGETVERGVLLWEIAPRRATAANPSG